MPDEVVIKEGLVGNSMYFIQQGMVRVIKGRETNQPVILGRLAKGDFFGEVALTSAAGARRTCSILSFTVLTLQRLTRKALDEAPVLSVAILVLSVAILVLSVAHPQSARRGVRSG